MRTVRPPGRITMLVVAAMSLLAIGNPDPLRSETRDTPTIAADVFPSIAATYVMPTNDNQLVQYVTVAAEPGATIASFFMVNTLRGVNAIEPREVLSTTSTRSADARTISKRRSNKSNHTIGAGSGGTS